jgi:hypothetical protein
MTFRIVDGRDISSHIKRKSTTLWHATYGLQMSPLSFPAVNRRASNRGNIPNPNTIPDRQVPLKPLSFDDGQKRLAHVPAVPDIGR